MAYTCEQNYQPTTTFKSHSLLSDQLKNKIIFYIEINDPKITKLSQIAHVPKLATSIQILWQALASIVCAW